MTESGSVDIPGALERVEATCEECGDEFEVRKGTREIIGSSSLADLLCGSCDERPTEQGDSE